MTLSDAQIREIAKCRNACVWLICLNLFLTFAFILIGSGATSRGFADATEMPFAGLCIAYVILGPVFVIRLARVLRRYWLLMFVPAVVIPAFGWIGLVQLYKVAERALGRDPARLPARHGLRRCPCGGTMDAVGARQWVVRNWGNAPAGYDVEFRCRSCGRMATIVDDLSVFVAALGMVLGGCFVCGLVASEIKGGTGPVMELLLSLGIMLLIFLGSGYAFLKAVLNRRRYPSC